MATIYKVTTTFNDGGYGIAVNTFTCQNPAATPTTDANVLSHMTTWITNIYAVLRPYMSNLTTHVGSVVHVMNADGTVNRLVGTIAPAVSGTGTADASASTTAFSASPKTAVPDVKGGKRFPTPVENAIFQRLLTNAALSALSVAFSYWASGVAFPGVATYVAGVISSKIGAFTPFVNGGTVKNVPGTQTTRKPLRGA